MCYVERLEMNLDSFIVEIIFLKSFEVNHSSASKASRKCFHQRILVVGAWRWNCQTFLNCVLNHNYKVFLSKREIIMVLLCYCVFDSTAIKLNYKAVEDKATINTQLNKRLAVILLHRFNDFAGIVNNTRRIRSAHRFFNQTFIRFMRKICEEKCFSYPTNENNWKHGHLRTHFPSCLQFSQLQVLQVTYLSCELIEQSWVNVLQAAYLQSCH